MNSKWEEFTYETAVVDTYTISIKRIDDQGHGDRVYVHEENRTVSTSIR